MPHQKRKVPLFFFLSFLWTWSAYCAIVLLGLKPYQGPGMRLLILGGCAPTFVGLLLIFILYNRADRIAYLKSIIYIRRIKAVWWLFMLLVFPLVYAAAIGLDLLLHGSVPQMTNLKAVIANPVSFFPLLLLSFLSGPFSEELGWRGYALLPMINRMGLAKAAVLLGLIWGIWHFPLYLMPDTWHGQMGFGLYGFVSFMVLSIGLSLIMAVVYMKTGQSIVSALVLHVSSNFTSQLLQAVSPSAELFRSIFVLVLGIALSIWYAKVPLKKDAVRIQSA